MDLLVGPQLSYTWERPLTTVPAIEAFLPGVGYQVFL